MIIRRANEKDAGDILNVTHKAFELYSKDLNADYYIPALSEKEANVLSDIKMHNVFVAEENGQILGAIRYQKLTDELAYIYRFGVSPEINNTGVGSGLLAEVIDECTNEGFKAIALHTNSRYYRLARYYYGKQFYVHSTNTDHGYIRALFVKELSDNRTYDISPAFNK